MSHAQSPLLLRRRSDRGGPPAPPRDGGRRPAVPARQALDRVVAAGAPGAVALAGGRTAAAGVADVRTGRPLRAGDRVRIGSVTKSFTAVVALQLVGEGRLGLDDTVGRRLPGVLPYGDRVTLRQLLDHTSGAARRRRHPADGAVPRRPAARLWTPAETIALVRDQPPRFPAGTGWAYSNTDYVLAGLMIERATGRTPRARARTADRAPAAAARHELPRPARPRSDRAATRSTLGPAARSSAPLRDITDYSPSFAWAAGNGVSTVRDVARFYRALLRGRLLAPRAAPPGAVRRWRPAGRAAATGSASMLRDTPYGTLVGHEGDIPGFSIKALSSLDGRHQAVVAINMKFAPAGRRRRVRRRRGRRRSLKLSPPSSA